MLKKNFFSRNILFLFFLNISHFVFAQTIDISKETELNEFKERNKSESYSYFILSLSDDSLAFYHSKSYKQLKNKNFALGLFSPETKLQYNSTIPFGMNDEAMIPNKGFQSYSNVGIYFRKGFISVQLRPEILFVQNRYFKTFPESYSDSIWSVRYRWYNQIDNPERFVNPVNKLYCGQSNIKLHFKSLSAGISNENMWWGPGKNNSLLMSNNAPGFGHIFFQTEKPIKTKIGKFEFQLISGYLVGSGELPPDTSRTYNAVKLYQPKSADSKRYINGLVFAYQPSFVKGLSVGFGRIFYLYKTDVQKNLDGYFPSISLLFKNQTSNEDSKRRDQIASLYLKQLFDHGKSNVYIEYGRNDHAWNLRDLITDFSHSRAYIVGVNKYFKLPKRKLLANIEFTDLSRSSQVNLRPTPDWYVHYQVLHGYTNHGKVVGATIGPGSAMQSLQLDFLKTSTDMFGFSFYRIEHNKDFYYDAFGSKGQYYRQWVDLVLGFKFNKSFRHLNFLSDLFLMHSFNYEWQDYSNSMGTAVRDGIDMLNLSANFTCQYRF